MFKQIKVFCGNSGCRRAYLVDAACCPWLFVLVICMVVTMASGLSSPVYAGEKQIKIVYTSNTWGYLEPCTT